jgi:CHASE2 domain-containing sensor protein
MRQVVALTILLIALAGCSSDTGQSPRRVTPTNTPVPTIQVVATIAAAPAETARQAESGSFPDVLLAVVLFIAGGAIGFATGPMRRELPGAFVFFVGIAAVATIAAAMVVRSPWVIAVVAAGLVAGVVLSSKRFKKFERKRVRLGGSDGF